MSFTYNIAEFDTFEIISRKVYGTEHEANRIARANPGVTEPLTLGTIIFIPDSPDTPQNLTQQSISNDPNAVAIIIDGKQFRFWNTVRINRSIDNFDTVDFTAPFDADNDNFRSTFEPFSYKKLVVTVGGEPLFTGTIISINPVLEPGRKMIAISAYSLPGVLHDCTMPANILDNIEFDGQNLREISTSIANVFGLGVDFQNEPGAVFDEKPSIEPKDKVLSFLIKLAKQRGLIISNTGEGKLLFHKSVSSGSPVAKLIQGFSPLISVIPEFNPQEYYSHITGIDTITTGLDGGKFTVKNPFLNTAIRPFTFDIPDTNLADIKTVVEAKMGRMLGNVVTYTIKVNTWRDRSGNLWIPNTTIKLTAKDAMIYDEYEFVIRSVDFERESNSELATLNLAIPGAFSGEIPESLPWAN